MRERSKPKPCSCGCEKMTKGGLYLPGHDTKLLSSIIHHVGGIQKLRKTVERQTRKLVVHTIEVDS